MQKSLNSGQNDEEIKGETRSARVAHKILSTSRSLSLEVWPDAMNQYTPLVAYSFTVNYILGVGSLAIPYAVYRAGIVLGIFMIVSISYISYMTIMWICEVCQRVRELDRKNEETKLLNDPSDFPELTLICKLYMGDIGAKAYQTSLFGLGYASLIGYSQVFINSLQSQVQSIGTIQVTNLHAASLFGAIVVPLSCLDLSEQINVQFTMSIVRFFALTFMFGSAGVAMFTDPYDGGSALNSNNTKVPYISDVPLVDFSGFGLLFSTVVFAQVLLAFNTKIPLL